MSTLFSRGNLYAALAGAGGGLLSYFGGEIVGAWAGIGQSAMGLGDLLLGSALWSGAIALVIGAAILIYSNLESLRGRWYRDLLGGLPLFFALGFLGGLAGQFAYLLIQNSLTRGIGWALMGASTGIGIGLLRRDTIQARRGACGGALGGFIGGFIFDGLSLLSSAGNGALSRLVGQIIMGALIALLMRVVQESLKSAWLLGISTGPYEGKEYPLNTQRVTVGREDSNAIALFREREMAAQLGALVFQNGNWMWQGAPVPINGAPQHDAILNSGDTLQLGEARFRFKSRSDKPGQNPVFPANTPAPPRTIANSGSTPPSSASPGAARTVANPGLTTPPPAFALVALDGQWLRLPDVSSPLTVGRGAGNGLVLPDVGVSSQHARLELKNGALYITDLGSTNGTLVNGQRLAPEIFTPLANGDTLRLGRLDFTVRRV